MAITAFGTGFRLTDSGDATNTARPSPDPLSTRIRVNAIHLIANATGGATTVTAGGNIIWSGTPTVSGTTIISSFGAPAELDAVGYTCTGATNANLNMVMLVFTC